MTTRIILTFIALFGLTAPLAATEAELSDPRQAALEAWTADPTRIFEAHEVDLDAFTWIARPVIVFADTPADPRFIEQMELLTSRIDLLVDRDVILITDTDPEAGSALRREYRPRGFSLLLVGKDGGIKLRKPFPWDVRELTASIDKMPMRREELRRRRLPE